MDKTALSYLLCSYTPGLGPMKMLQIESKLTDLSLLLQSSASELDGVLGKDLSGLITTARENFDREKIVQELEKGEITYLAKSDSRYPEQLLNISDPPIGLFIKGNIDVLTEKKYKVGIVGTRKTSQYGINATTLLVSQMSNFSPAVISGMAIGIDSVAHLEALRHHMPTIAVLGCGVNIIYPRENASLYEKIIASGGAIISEFTPAQTVSKGLFVNRNRIISALSDSLVVVEGQLKSGSLITARYALDQGKDVYAVPGPITSINSEGTNDLIKNGATPLLHANQLFEHTYQQPQLLSNKLENLSQNEKTIIDALLREELSSDEIGEKFALSTSQVAQILTKLELLDLIIIGHLGKISLRLS